MKQILILAILTSLLVSCSSTPSENAIQTAIAQTQAIQSTSTQFPVDTPTTTPIPLDDIDLESILLLYGDLPNDFVGEQISSNRPPDLKITLSQDQVIRQKISSGKLVSDGVVIFLYESISDLDKVYDEVLSIEGLKGKRTLYRVGEKGMFLVDKGSSIPLIGGGSIPNGNVVKVVFTRCHALVYIDLFSPEANETVATTYAQRLDERLTPLVCR